MKHLVPAIVHKIYLNVVQLVKSSMIFEVRLWDGIIDFRDSRILTYCPVWLMLTVPIVLVVEDLLPSPCRSIDLDLTVSERFFAKLFSHFVQHNADDSRFNANKLLARIGSLASARSPPHSPELLVSALSKLVTGFSIRNGSWDKFSFFRTSPSLQCYLIKSTSKAIIKHPINNTIGAMRKPTPRNRR